MKNLLKFVSIVLLLQPFVVYGQSNNLNGVYAGVEVMPSALGGMTRNDVVILFRPDGTFNDDLSKQDWQKRVAGRYTVSGRTVSLRSNGDREATNYTLDKDGNMNAGSYNLVRQPTDSSIPKGNYEFSSAAGSTVGGTAVGSFSNKALYFDGQGHFSTNSQTTAIVSGSNVGGGNSHKSNGIGNYQINKGVLTLTFADGTTQFHSFFCRPGYDPVMAVIDGKIYFVKKGRNK